jgi:uncharacterized phage protein (TIGR01671 family)
MGKGETWMRTIKFRAWDKDHSLMVFAGEYNDELVSFHGNAVEVDFCGNGIFTLNYELMQFTGLTDKNGVEIYEGDIVYFEIFDGLVDVKGKAKVYFENGCFRLNRIHPLCDYFNVGDVEVIGNIYENPEVL